jgi:hypothetical protein
LDLMRTSGYSSGPMSPRSRWIKLIVLSSGSGPPRPPDSAAPSASRRRPAAQRRADLPLEAERIDNPAQAASHAPPRPGRQPWRRRRPPARTPPLCYRQSATSARRAADRMWAEPLDPRPGRRHPERRVTHHQIARRHRFPYRHGEQPSPRTPPHKATAAAAYRPTAQAESGSPQLPAQAHHTRPSAPHGAPRRRVHVRNDLHHGGCGDEQRYRRRDPGDVGDPVREHRRYSDRRDEQQHPAPGVSRMWQRRRSGGKPTGPNHIERRSGRKLGT